MWECFGCCPDCAAPALMAAGCVMVAAGAKGSFPSSSDDATKPTNIIPLSNPQTRTTGFQGTRICMTEPPGTKSAAYDFPLLYCQEPQTYFVKILLFVIVGEDACLKVLSCACTDLNSVCYNSAQSMDRCSASRQPADGFLAVFHTVHLLSISYRKLVIFGGTD